MPESPKSRTADANGPLWGARARDWVDLVEGNVRPTYDAVLKRTEIGSGTRYLDIGCGAGMAAQMAAALGAQVSGIDAAETMPAVARERVPKGEFRQGEIEALPYADGSFDVVTGFNAFQFAGNPVTALREGRRVAKPGGQVAIVTWGDPEGMQMVAVITALRPLMPPPPPGTPGPFVLSDETALRRFATEAGLTPVEVFDVDNPFRFPDEATALHALAASGVAARVIRHAGEAAVDEAHAQAIAAFRQADGSYRLGASFRCLLTRV